MACAERVECLVAPLTTGVETRVAILRSPDTADPWVYLAPGGPGLSNVDELQRSAEALATLYPNLTFWTFDDANTGNRFDPDCDEIALSWLSDPGPNLDERSTKELSSCLSNPPPTVASEFGSTFEFVTNNVADVPVQTAVLGISYGADAALSIAAEYPEIVSRIVIDAPAMTAGRLLEDIRHAVQFVPGSVSQRADECVRRGGCAQLQVIWPNFPTDFIRDGNQYSRALALRLASLSDQSSEQLFDLITGAARGPALDELVDEYVRGGWSHISTAAMLSVGCASERRDVETTPDRSDASVEEIMQNALERPMTICPPRAGQRVTAEASLAQLRVPLLALLNENDPVSDFEFWAPLLEAQQIADVIDLRHYGHSSFAQDPCGRLVTTRFLRDDQTTTADDCDAAALAATTTD